MRRDARDQVRKRVWRVVAVGYVPDDETVGGKLKLVG